MMVEINVLRDTEIMNNKRNTCNKFSWKFVSRKLNANKYLYYK